MATYPALDLTFAPGPGAGTLQDMLYAELDAFEPVAIHEHDTGDGWRVFFRSATLRDAARGALASEFGNALLRLTAVNVDDEDWAKRSQATLKAVHVGRIVVAPPWDVPAPQPAGHDAPPTDPIIVVIDPSTGFGTGHHATTRLCLELLQRLEIGGARVIDVGTGSGVLAIAAVKLGAGTVIAIDNDADALQNASENATRNGVVEAIEIVNGDLSMVSIEGADVVVANLTSSALQRHASALHRLIAPEGGTIIVSGFGRDELEDVTAAIGGSRSDLVEEREWVAAALRIANQ